MVDEYGRGLFSVLRGLLNNGLHLLQKVRALHYLHRLSCRYRLQRDVYRFSRGLVVLVSLYTVKFYAGMDRNKSLQHVKRVHLKVDVYTGVRFAQVVHEINSK